MLKVLGKEFTLPLRVIGWLSSGKMYMPLSESLAPPWVAIAALVSTVKVFASGTDSITNSLSVGRGLPMVKLR
jgi:hypothetical protein